MSGAQDAQHPVEAAADDAAEDESAGAPGLPRAEVTVALKRCRDLIARFKDRYTAAMECLERDLDECVTYSQVPEAHHQRIRTTNRLEQSPASRFYRYYGGRWIARA